ncbi:MAG: hypothetical protein HQ511_03415 [Rhodospirillales bacterium]|nr:hypothetical protein [Rhodospirillales bacterium]
MIRFLYVVSVNVGLLVLLLEMASLILFFSEKRVFFYARSPVNVEDYRNRPLNTVFHPYFGYVRRFVDGSNGWVNNDGFVYANTVDDDYDPVDYPFAPTSDQYVIGVFGGSVAQHFFHHQQRFHTVAKLLGKLPQFEGKEIIFLQFAFAGFKQPQQMLIFSFYQTLEQPLDMALVIDGFNEVAHGAGNAAKGVPIAMPVDDIWNNMGRYVEGQNALVSGGYGAKAQWHKWAAANHRRAAERDCQFAACYYYRVALSNWHDRRHANSIGRNEISVDDWTERSHFITRKGHSVSPNVFDWPVPAAVYVEIADQWENSLRAMNDIANARGITVLQILQPNMYFPRNRVFPPLDPNDKTYIRFIEPVEEGYPELLDRYPGMLADGINAVDGTAMMDEAADQVLIDDCCHYNDAGNEIMSKFIAAQIHNVTSLR